MPLWVRGHIGNEEADNEALAQSIRSTLCSTSHPLVTHKGLRAISRSNRAAERRCPGYGKNRSEWHRTAMTGFRWLRCNKGPIRHWLQKIGKADSLQCPCGHHKEGGDHLTFQCPTYPSIRNKTLGSRRSRIELDEDVFIQDKDDPEVWYEATEEWYLLLPRLPAFDLVLAVRRDFSLYHIPICLHTLDTTLARLSFTCLVPFTCSLSPPPDGFLSCCAYQVCVVYLVMAYILCISMSLFLSYLDMYFLSISLLQ